MSKTPRRNLNDAFIAQSDEDECMPSDDSSNDFDTAHASTGNALGEKAKTVTTEKKKKLSQDNTRSSTGKSSYSSDYLKRNLNLQSPSELYSKNKKSQSIQGGKLKRAESLSAYDKSQNKLNNLCSNKTRRSLESNNLDIWNNGTPKYSKTLRRSKFENFPQRPTPKTSQSKPSSEEELVDKNLKASKFQSRRSCPGCVNAATAQLNIQRPTREHCNIKLPDLFTQVSAQTVRNLTAWRRSECNTVNSITNMEISEHEHNISNTENNFEESTCFPVCSKGNRTDSESNINRQFAFSSPNLTDLLRCSFEPIKILNTDLNLLETQLLSQNDLSGISSPRHARIKKLKNGEFRKENYLNHSDVLRKTADDQEFLNQYSKQKYYEKRKVDLVELECREVEMNSACAIKNVKSVCNTKGTDKSPQQMNSNRVIPENSSESELSEAKSPLHSLARDGSPNRQLNQFSRVITPESPISALMNKNLSELSISK